MRERPERDFSRLGEWPLTQNSFTESQGLRDQIRHGRKLRFLTVRSLASVALPSVVTEHSRPKKTASLPLDYARPSMLYFFGTVGTWMPQGKPEHDELDATARV